MRASARVVWKQTFNKHFDKENDCVDELLTDVTRNSVLNGKTQLIEAVQTKVSYFILLKITYRITNWTPYRHCIG